MKWSRHSPQGYWASAICNLTKTCPIQDCLASVSFMEDILFNTKLSNLSDREMTEKCLTAAYVKTVTNIDELMEFCKAGESIKTAGCNTMGGLHRASTYNSNKAKVQRQPQPNATIQLQNWKQASLP